MTAAPSIRLATRDDMPAFKRLVDATGMFPREHLDSMIPGYFDNGGTDDLWLICDDGGPSAVAFCAPERVAEGTWTLYLLAVDPDSQSKGIGGIMLAHIEALLVKRGARLLLVGTSSFARYDRARAFYRAHGYREAARIGDFYSSGEDQIVLRKVLAIGT